MFVRSLLCVGGEGEWSLLLPTILETKVQLQRGSGLCKDSPFSKGGDRERERGPKWAGSGGEGFALGIEDPSQFKSQQHCVVFEQKKTYELQKETKVSIFQLKHLIFCLIARVYKSFFAVLEIFLRWSGSSLLCLRRRGFADLVKPDSLLLLLLFGSLHRFRFSFRRQRGGGRGKRSDDTGKCGRGSFFLQIHKSKMRNFCTFHNC